MTETETAIAAALAALPELTPRRLVALLRAGPLPEVWEAVRQGRVASLPGVAPTLRGRRADRCALVPTWQRFARGLDPGRLAADLDAGGVAVRVIDREGYPAVLAADPEPPGVLFTKGDPAALEAPRVAIVGTRRCTHYGRDVAASLGRDLAEAGVAVVSGLALGIDGSAHEGSLRAEGERAGRPVGVVGSGIDVVYPRSHRSLWGRVAARGLLASEAPLGATADPWRFPRRNRILAALASVVVVVESHPRGGSMLTVQAAIERGVPVMAVPGSVRSPSSAGTNRLLADGAAPVLDAGDVLVALSLEGAVVAHAASPVLASERLVDAGHQAQPEVEGDLGRVLAAVDWTPLGSEDVVRRTGLDLGVVARSLHDLEARGLVRRHGAWWERAGP